MTDSMGNPGIHEILEALFFAADEPLPPKQVIEIFRALEAHERPWRVTEETILRTVDELNQLYEENGRSFRIVKVAGGYQFATEPKYALWLGKMIKDRAKRKLSQSALESLAVIAYKQPVTKPEIESIRGVNADYVIRSLLERDLITIVGRAATPGRPLLYGTTRQFLKHFGLNDLAELPKPREIDELLSEADFEVEKQMLAAGEGKGDSGDEDSRSIVISEDGTLKEIQSRSIPPGEAPPAGDEEPPTSSDEET